MKGLATIFATKVVLKCHSPVRQIALLLSVLLVSACESGGSAGDPDSTDVNTLETRSNILLVEQPALQWAECVDRPVLDCTTLLVPMDYSNPGGETIEIAIARARADVQTRRRTLLVNPGGPGAGGINTLELLVRFADIPSAVEQSHDFVSFDPRGIGNSTPVRCDLSARTRLDFYPVSRSENQQNLDFITRSSQDCFNREGEYVKHLGSTNVVRDMNEIRKALRLSQFDFLGYSYGTRLAALFMQTYPEYTGRFVLDGSMSPEPGLANWLQATLLPSQQNIEAIAAACGGFRLALCSPREFLTQLQSRADEVGRGPNTVEAALLFSILRFAAQRPGFEDVIVGPMANYLDTGDIEQLEFLVNELGTGEALESEVVFSDTAYIAVFCADDPVRYTIESLEALQSPFNAVSDLFSELVYSNVALCTGWPEAIDPMPRIATNQAPASLVIGGPTDSQTPIIFAEEMAAAVGGQFLRSEHPGHTTVFSRNNACTNSAVEVFLTTGELPTTSVCEGSVFAGAVERWYEPNMRMH